MMLGPATRVSVIQQFVTSNFEGIVIVGEVNELVAAIILLFAF